MIKKPTLLVLLCAIILGGAVYYFEFRNGGVEKPTITPTKPAFSVQPSDIVSFTITHPAQLGDTPVHFEKRDGAWQIVQPIQTEADQPTADGIIDALTSAQIAQTEPGTPDRRKAYGLDPAQISLEFELKNGTKHTLLVGSTNFTGDSVYTVVDGGQSVSVLPQLLSTGAGKSLPDLRDRTVLHIDNAQVSSFGLKNASGDLAALKGKDEWKFDKPSGALADKDAVDAVLAQVANAKMISVASETPDNLAKYGLANPAITFTATDDKGTKSTLIVGKKEDTGYFARDTSRSAIFIVNEDLYKKLSVKFSDLRDKKMIHDDMAGIHRVEVHNSSGVIAFSRKSDNPDEWTFESPQDQKGKSAAASKILDVVGGLHAEEVIDHPASGILSQLANPAVRVILTGENNKETELKLSKPSGDFVYVQVTDSEALYKVKKQVAQDLDIKPADLIF